MKTIGKVCDFLEKGGKIMFWKKRNKILVVLLALALLVGQLSGINFKKANAADTGYTELTFSDFGIANQSVTSTVSGSNATVTANGLDKIAFNGYITIPTTSSSNYIQFGNLFRLVPSNNNQFGVWKNQGGGWYGWSSDIGTAIVGNKVLLRLEFTASGDDLTMKYYLNGAAAGSTTMSGGVSAFTSREMTVGVVSGSTYAIESYKEASDDTTGDTTTGTYTEYTFSDFGHTEGVVGGADTTSATTASKYNDTIKANASLDKVAFTGYVKFDSDAVGAGSAIRFGSMVAVMLESGSNSLRLRNPGGSNAAYADPIDCGQSVKGAFFKLRLEFDKAENGADYIAKLYVEDDLKATVTLTGGVASFAAYTPLMVIAAAGETVEYKDYTDGYTELTFSDFGINDQTLASGARVTGTNATVTAKGLDKVAFSGYVTYASDASTGSNVRFGNLVGFLPAAANQFGLWNMNTDSSWWGFTSDKNIVLKGAKVLMRAEFDVSGSDYVVKTYMNGVNVGTTTLTNGVNLFTAREMIVTADKDLAIASYKKGETYREMTFRDLGIADQKVIGDASAAKSIQSSGTFGSAAECLNDVAFTGHIKFPTGATAMANTVQFGNFLSFTTETATSLRLRNPNNNAAYGDVIDCGKTITGTFIKFRLEFNIVDGEYVAKVYVDDTLVATQTLTGSKAAFTWFPMIVRAEAAKTVEIKSYPEIAKTFTEVTFKDFTIADQTVFGGTTASVSVGGKNGTIETTKSLKDYAFTGYIKFMSNATNGGSSLQLGNLVKIITVSDTAVQLKNPNDNTSYTDAIDCGTAVKGRYVKFRMEFEVANDTDYLVTLYADDKQVGQTTIAGGVAQFTYTTLLVYSYTYEKVSVKSCPENPATYTELTFNDFQLADQTIVGSSTAATAISNYNAAIKTSQSLSGVAFTGYIKFQDGAGAMMSKLQFGTLAYLTLENSTSLRIRSTADNSAYSEVINCGKTITGKYIKVRFEFTVANTNDYIVRLYVDDVEQDAYIVSGGVNSFKSYTALVASAGTSEQFSIKSYPAYASTDVRVYEDLTNHDFNIENGTYTKADDVSGAFGETVTGSGNDTLNGKKISTNVTFSQADSAIYIGGTDKTTGLMIGTDANEPGKLLVKEASDLGALTAFYADEETAGTKLVGSEVKLTVSMENVDSDNDANKDDLKVGLYFNDKLYNGEYIYLKDYTPGTYMGVVASNADSSIKVRAVDRNDEKKNYKYHTLPSVMESQQGGYYVLGNGMLNVRGEINGVFDESLQDCIYGATYVAKDGSDWYMRIAGTTSASWETLDIAAMPDGRLQFSHATKAFTEVWNLGFGLDFKKELQIEMAFSYVDADWDGLNNDVKVGIWVNGKLTGNRYFYLIDYVSRMGQSIIYVDDANNLQLFENGEKKLMDESYDSGIDADGFVIPDCDEATIDGKAVTSGTKVNKTGAHEVTYTDHGATYKRTITISKTGDANLDSELGSKDIINMMLNDGVTVSSDLHMKCSDITQDGTINSSDRAHLQDLILGNTTAEALHNNYNKKFIVGVMSDNHLRADGINDYQRQNNYRQALEYYKNRGAGVIILNGDISDLGEATSYDKLVNIFNEVYADVPVANRPQVVTTADNHEYFDAWWWNRSDWGATSSERQNSTQAANALQASKNLFRDKMKAIDTPLASTSGYYMHTVRSVNGYFFIGMSEDHLLGGAAGYNPQSVTWLDEQLAAAKNADPTKPIFVAIHQPPQNTVLASEKYGNGITAFTSVLNKYPQAIVIGSHTHAPIKDERSIHQSSFTTINTGSTYYYSRSEYTADGGATQVTWANPQLYEEQFSEGHLFVVEGSKVTVERWDFWNGIKAGADWTIDASKGTSGFLYTDAQHSARAVAPSFKADTTLEIQKVSGTEVKLVFPSAVNNGSFVQHYQVLVKNGSTTEQTLKYHTDFYYHGIYNMDPMQTLSVTGLTSGVKYTFEVRAVETFGKTSGAITATMS